MAAAVAIAQPRAIDTGKSVMKVRVSKAGLLSGLGHEHEISAPIASGTVDTKSGQVVLRVHARSLRVLDPGISDKDREEIQSNMTGVKVLDAERFSEIVFRAAGASPGLMKGDLTLHGQTHPVTVNVREDASHFTGTARLKQSDFGITPVKVAGGAVRVKDEIQIEFDIQLAR
ncbi:MAG TPA: YceI family protein [Bryobacteraceae bacterium]